MICNEQFDIDFEHLTKIILNVESELSVFIEQKELE